MAPGTSIREGTAGAGASLEERVERTRKLGFDLKGWGLVFLAALGLGLAFQGSRGLWEPDEGYYSNVALDMVRGGDWLVPRLNGEAFLDKPPLLYWTMALGVNAVGEGEWGLRAGNAMAFAATVLVLGLLAAGWWGRRAGHLAALFYATSVGPFLAANILTPDTVLAAMVVGAYACFWRERTAGAPGLARWGWAVLLGVFLGLGALTKGPAIFVFALPLAPIAVHDRWRGGARQGPLFLTLFVFVAVAAPWYLAIVDSLPGAFEYLVRNQVSGRLFSAEFERNAGPWGGFKVYLPTLVIGVLPWGLIALGRFPRPGELLRRLRTRRWTIPSPAGLLLGWLVLPLLVLLAARSRLPLYVLPLFAPLALVAARWLADRWPVTPRGLLRGVVACGLWIGVLLAGKAVAAHLVFGKDSRRLATELRAMGVVPSERLVLVDAKRNGLALYGWSELRPATFDPTPYPFFRPPKPIREMVESCRRGRPTTAFLAARNKTEPLASLLHDAGLSFQSREIASAYVVFLVDGPATPAESPDVFGR